MFFVEFQLSMADWIITFSAKRPGSDDPWTTGVTFAKFGALTDNGDLCRAARLKLVPEVLANPESIHNGWNRPGTEECYIYIGHPASDWRSPTIETPPPKGHAFIVCVLPDGQIDYWGWREDDENLLPRGIGEMQP